MFHSRLAMLVVAALLAILAASAVALYVSRAKTEAQKNNADVTVVVAARDIPAGTAASDLTKKGYVKIAKIALSALAPTAVRDVSSLSGRVAIQTVFANSQLLNEQFQPKPNNPVSNQVKGTYRAVQVPLDQSRGLISTLKSGDHVDVLGSFQVQRLDDKGNTVGTQIPITVTVIHDVTVLKAPNTGDGSGVGASNNTGGSNTGNASGAAVFAMLRVSDADAQRLIYSLEWGKIWLTLRGDHPADSPGFDTKPLDTATPQVTTIASVLPALRGFRVLDPGISGGATGGASGGSSSKGAKGV
jgi:pilus assembly protein CpaB